MRAYAAEKGELPEKLEQLKLPVAEDPMGKGFAYRLLGAGRGVLTVAGEGDGFRLEVELRK